MNIHRTNPNDPAIALTGDAYQDYAHYDGTTKTSYNPECQGLTKLEYFSLKIMSKTHSINERPDIAARKAVKAAKLLIEELNK
jgi:hypothetical protein